MQRMTKMASALRDTAKTLGIVTVLAVGFTWFGVYGTSGPVWLRFVMWFVTMLVGSVASFWVVPFVFHTHLKTAHPALRVLVASLLLAIPVTLTLYIFFAVLGATISVWNVPIQFGYVLAVCLVVTTGGFLIDRARRLAELEDAEPEDRVAGFLQRLPIRFRGASLWAISSEDHYLRVYTDRGEELILMRLADAVRELGEDNGLQTHRSWWVSHTGVADTRRTNGKLFLILKSGQEAPVSRTYQPSVRAAGLA
jgi:LytTr DNA-binding domain